MMITVKIQSKAWKKDFITRPLSELEVMREELGDNCSHMHEIMPKRIRPTFDFDYKCRTIEKFRGNFLILQAARQEVLAQFPQTKFPKAVVVNLVSSGPTAWEEKTPEVAVVQGWKISAHFVVRGVGSWTLSQIREVINRFSALKEHWDNIYSVGKSLRMPYCTKEGESRFLQRAEISLHDVICYNEFDAAKQFKETYHDWLMTNDEPEYGEEKVVNKKMLIETDDSDDDSEEDLKWIEWSFNKASAIIDRLHSQRAKTHKERTDGICSIIHLAKILKKVKKFRVLAHEFAKKDPDYSEAQTDDDYDYFQRKTVANPRTFASLIQLANIDTPEVEMDENEDIPLTFYDKTHELLHRNPKPKRAEMTKHLLGCLRYCDRKGVEQWYQHSTDGWYEIKNKNNFPFSTLSSNESFEDTDLQAMVLELKSTPIFKARCLTEGSVFYPWCGVNDRPNIINLFRGWPMVKTDYEDNEAVDEFLDYIDMLFDQAPQVNQDGWYVSNHDKFDPKFPDYVLKTIARKLQYPREKGKTICGYGKFGGEGKNVLEMFLTKLFGEEHCVKSAGTKELLGQGEAGFNPLAEKCLVAFVQEAKKDGESIVSNEKFRNWQTESTQTIRRMRENPFQAANYGQAFIWTNNKSFMKMDTADFRRMFIAHINPSMIDETDPRVKKYFDDKLRIIRCPKKMQAIFNHLITLDVDGFDANKIAVTSLMEYLKDASLSSIQKWVQELCNDEDVPRTKKGHIHLRASECYPRFRAWSQEEGMTERFIAQKPAFRETLKDLDIVFKLIKIDGTAVQGCVIDLVKVESMMRKMLKNKLWCLIKEKDNVIDDDE
jgi:hypothetical protein